jgi:hypothetical protein
MKTKHAKVRAQQRSIPPLVDELLDRFWQEEHVGSGAIKVYFGKSSIRNMERDWGHRPVSRLAEWFHVYKVRSTDGHTITMGRRTHRLQRK